MITLSNSAANLSLALTIVLDNTTEPHTVKEALTRPQWIKAIDDEITALSGSQFPAHQKCWWSAPNGTKLHSNGTVLKAHLVGKGFNQQEGIDFDETFSFVIKPTTICLVLTIAVVQN